jgi:hypothetical protein
MTTPHPTKTADQCEARIVTALELETPIQQVTYDEAIYPPPDLAQMLEGEGSQSSHLVENGGTMKRFYKLIIAFGVILVAISLNLGSILGLKDAATAVPMTPMDEFMRNLPAYSLKMAQANASSPQAKALSWLQGDSDYELYRLNQRYALGVLYYSMEGELRNSSLGWMSNSSECEWDTGDSGGNCDDFSRLLSLEFSQVAISGSIPRELELLTDLQTLGFSENGHSMFWGPIHSELYVS